MGTIAQIAGLYLRNKGMYEQSEKKMLNSNIISTFPQYGELRPTNR